MEATHLPVEAVRTHVHAAQRHAFLTLIVAAWVVLAGAIFTGLWLTTWAYTGKLGDFAFTTTVVTDLAPELASITHTEQYFASVTVSSAASLVLPRVLAAIATALPFLLVILGCIGTITLSRRLLTARPFTRVGQALLFALGGLATVSSVLVGWLTARGTEIAIAQLELPTSGTLTDTSAPENWVVPPAFDPLQDLDWPLLALGVTLLLVALFWRQATRLQHDAEGLV